MLGRLQGFDIDHPAALQAQGDQRARRGQWRVRLAGGAGVGGGKALEDFPVAALVLATRKQRAVQPRHPAHREGVEDQVVVVLGQRRGRGQDQVGVAGGLVAVGIDRDHEVETRQGAAYSLPAMRSMVVASMPVSAAGSGGVIGLDRHRECPFAASIGAGPIAGLPA